MRLVLTITFSALTLCAASLPAMAARDTHSDSRNPDAITCQVQPIRGMAQLRGKPVCRRNSEWARMSAASPNMEGPSGTVPTLSPPPRSQP